LIINIIFILGFFISIVLNIISFEGAYKISINVNLYLKGQKIENYNNSGFFPFFLDIINTILQFLCILLFVLYSVFYYLDTKTKGSITEQLLIN
jgi:hypothetical protein